MVVNVGAETPGILDQISAGGSGSDAYLSGFCNASPAIKSTVFCVSVITKVIYYGGPFYGS